MSNRTSGSNKNVIVFAAGVIFLLMTCLWGIPKYNLYSKTLAGEANLAQANSERQAIIATAKAREEAATALANAEIIRAGGVAEANRVLSEQLGGPEAYLQWLFITQALGRDDSADPDDGHCSQDKTVIYVPMEGGMPILEATRLGSQ